MFIRCLLIAVLLWAPAAVAQPTVVGTWLTQDRDGLIQIGPCGSTICGRIVGAVKVGADGAAPRDIHGQSQCGLVIMRNFTEIRTGLWDGKITNPEDGRVYSSQMQLDESGRLRMRGYLAIPLLGATQVWTRYDGVVRTDCRMQRP